MDLRDLLAVIAAALTLSLSSSAWANEPDAEEAFALGVEAEDAGDNERASEYYRIAYQEIRTARVAANLGLVELKLGRLPQAAQHLSEALEFPLADADRLELQSVLDTILRQVGTLDVWVMPHSALVEVDGTATKAGGRSRLFVKPGAHTVVASNDGYFPARVRVSVEAGERVAVKLELVDRTEVQPPPATLPPAPTPSKRRMQPATIVLVTGTSLTSAALAIGTGFAFAGRASEKEAESIRQTFEPDPTHSYCYENPDPQCAKLSELVSQQGRQNRAAYASFWVGGGLAVVTATTYYLVKKRRRNRVEMTITPHGVTTRVAF